MSLIIPEIFAGLTREAFDSNMRVGSLATNLGVLSGNVGDTVKFPYWKLINYPTTVTKGTPLQPQTLEQDEKTATIVQKGSAVQVFDYDDMTAMGNHINEAATQLGMMFARQLDIDLVSEAKETPLIQETAGATSITNTNLNAGFQLFGDSQNVEDMAGIVIHSMLVPSFYAMNEFVDGSLTHTKEGSGIVRNGLLGYYRSVPVYVADHGTWSDTENEALAFIIKKNSLAYMEKHKIRIETERDALSLATNVVGSYTYATKLINSSGVVLLRNTLPTPEEE